MIDNRNEKIVPASRPYFSPEDTKYILSEFKEILDGNSYLSMHKHGELFEKKFSEFIGTKYAVACNSGTSALELIFRSLDVTSKEVILPSNTFLATAIAVVNAGGNPVFADCDDTMCLDFDDVINRINKDTRAICQVHIGGIISESTIKLRDYCESNNIYFVEDAAQAHGSSLNGTKAGNFGVASGFSFFSTKVMTTGEGGMVTTNQKNLVPVMKSMREFGKVRKGIYTNWHESFGYNWRLPEVASLMGLRQLKSVDKFVTRRRAIAKFYDDSLSSFDSIKLITPPSPNEHNYFKYLLVVKGKSREFIHNKMFDSGVSLSGYVYEFPLHKLPIFKEHNNLKLPKTEYYCSKHIGLPIFYDMSDSEVEHVIGSFIKLI